ncbi:hypothetical protein [Thalassobaculum sp.]|uniref:hypothetical protein n=1 Tax=Thalassobaculum sp. TaxID=2022740 RepID=UPI0032EB3356
MTDPTADRNRDTEATATRALIRQGLLAEALGAVERGLRGAPGDPALWQLRGVALRRHRGPGPAAAQNLRRAPVLAPAGAGAWAELCLNSQIAGDAALDRLLQRALVCDPGNDGICDLALRLRGNAAAVLAVLLAARPERAKHHHAAAVLSQARGREHAARDGYRRALCLDPTHTDTFRRIDRNPLASAQAWSRLRWLDRLAVLTSFRDALRLQATGAGPSMLARQEDGRTFADRQERAIGALNNGASDDGAPNNGAVEDDPARLAEEAGDGPVMTFPSAYWGIDNTPLLLAAGTLNSRRYTARHAPTVLRRRPGGSRPSVGIVTAHGFAHSVWRAIGSDWAAHLATTDAQVTLYDMYGLADGQASAGVDAVVAGPRPIQGWVDTLTEAGHDVLMYPEIGMDPAAMTLAALRLAPLQAAGWGHPTTTGLPTVDRYLSAARYETADGDAHYSETLVRLPGVGVRVHPDRSPAAPFDRAALGLAPGDAAVALVQSVFKYTPAFDTLLARIARSAPSVRFFVFAAGSPAQVAFWQDRVGRTFADAGADAADHIRLLQSRPVPAFRRLLATMDAYLDPPDFSGYNTGLRAIETGCPLVTLEGPRLRHRLAAGLLREAGADATVTTDADGYVGTVLRLLNDPDLRAAAGAAQREGLDRLVDAGDGNTGRADLRGAFLRAIGLA